MPSDAQLNANRENAKRSTGPLTPNGKDTSSRNATRHGLTSRHLSLKPGQQAEFTNLHESLLAAWNPVDAQESALVRQIAEAQWRYESAQSAHDQLMFSASSGFQSTDAKLPDAAADALAIQQHAKDLLLYQRYAAGFERSMVRLIAALRQLQNFRLKKQKQEKEEARAEADTRDSWENLVENSIQYGWSLTKPQFRRLTPEQHDRYVARMTEIKRQRDEEEAEEN